MMMMMMLLLLDTRKWRGCDRAKKTWRKKGIRVLFVVEKKVYPHLGHPSGIKNSNQANRGTCCHFTIK